jgi:hypothetical protein
MFGKFQKMDLQRNNNIIYCLVLHYQFILPFPFHFHKSTTTVLSLVLNKNVSVFYLFKFKSLFFYVNIWMILYFYINGYFLNFNVENVAAVVGSLMTLFDITSKYHFILLSLTITLFYKSDFFFCFFRPNKKCII